MAMIIIMPMSKKVANAIRAVANVDDYSGSARLLAATTLRNVLGTKNLGDILSERESIANEMQDLLLEATEPWGVTVERVEVQKFHLFLIIALKFFSSQSRFLIIALKFR